MKPWWSSWLLVLLSFACVAETSSAALSRLSWQGRDYVRLNDWSQSHKYRFQWLTPEKDIQITTSWSKLLFTVDTKVVDFNGTKVWLNAPVLFRNGSAYLAQIDLDKTISPLLFPPRAREKEKVQVICLDPGHGGKDPGNEAHGVQEKRYVLLLAQEVRQQLLKLGFKVYLTRNSDTFVPLEDRPAIAKLRQADLFVSLHFNGVPNSRIEARGIETYCLTPAQASSTNAGGEGAHTGALTGNDNDERNLYLAYLMQRSLVRVLGTDDRGVRRARFAVLRGATMPAILVEGGFLSDPGEGKKIVDPAYRQQMAKAIVRAIVDYQRLLKD